MSIKNNKTNQGKTLTKRNKKAKSKTLTKRNKKAKSKTLTKRNKKVTGKTLTKSNKKLPLKLTKDVVFKYLFKNNRKFCTDLIKRFIPPLKGRKIKILNFLDSVTPDHPEDKGSLLDILVQVDGKELINIEMQCFRQEHFTERILFYWAKLFLSQSKVGKKYKSLHPTYSLVFTTRTLFKELKEYCSCFSIRCEENPNVVFSSHFKLVLVELDKFKKKESIEHLDKKELWCYLLNWWSELTKKEKQDLTKRSGLMKQVVEKLNKQEMKQRLQLLQDFRDKARYDREAQLDYAKKEARKVGRKVGRQEGIKKGMREGIEKGIEKGIKKGVREGIEKGIEKEQTKVILNMLKEKLDIKLVSKITGVSVKEIKKLKNSS